jgi:hypothetical protein
MADDVNDIRATDKTIEQLGSGQGDGTDIGDALAELARDTQR